MGVIKKQSTISAIFSYIGVVVGFVTSALIMPKILDTNQIGLIKLIVAVSGVFSGIFSLGVGQLLIRSYQKFDSEKEKRSKLYGVAIKVVIFGSLLAIPFYIFGVDSLFNLKSDSLRFTKGTTFLTLVYLTIVARIFYSAIFGYYRMQNEIIIDAFIQNIFHKLGVLVLLVALFLEYFNFSTFIYLYIILYLFFPIIIIYYFQKKKDVDKEVHQIDLLGRKKKSRFSSIEKKEFLNLLLFGTLTTIGGSLFLYVDTLMVNFYLSESEVGIYGTMFLFGMIVIIPARSLKSISVSVLSKSFQANDFKEITEIYKKSSITLLVIGGYIFIGVWSNMYSVFGYLPESFELGKYVVLFIGIGQLLDMVTGVNNEIIAVSPKYKLNTYFIILSIFLGVGINLWLIPQYGITGAAIATMGTILFVNLMRLITVYKYFKIHPFSTSTIKIILLIVGLTLLMEVIPNIENHFINLLIKGSLITIIYLPIVYYSKVSEDLNQMIDKLLKTVFLRK
ncbi:lipopolysaccharide biosynthesis protein [Brumimicrobium mesophilum]|uniref:lipopolysaccharide biosynthesis protein n=1 Tax=Brumimicrobium mesophilum TaxID=392717 RepID=UPI000D144BB0|nr:polysaccharide biosynthesis C-terminal domain-containing protein [Brumimicrobium mesophilum]